MRTELNWTFQLLCFSSYNRLRMSFLKCAFLKMNLCLYLYYFEILVASQASHTHKSQMKSLGVLHACSRCSRCLIGQLKAGLSMVLWLWNGLSVTTVTVQFPCVFVSFITRKVAISQSLSKMGLIPHYRVSFSWTETWFSLGLPSTDFS